MQYGHKRKKVNHPSSRSLKQLAKSVGQALLVHGITITTAESCTGGYVAKCLTDVAGSSQWFEMGFVTYGNTAKTKLLGVSPSTLQRFGAVSGETAAEMSRGALLRASANISVAVTGIAGPGGAVLGKPVGTVWFGWSIKQGRQVRVITRRENFNGNRDAVRRQSVHYALLGVVDLLRRSA